MILTQLSSKLQIMQEWLNLPNNEFTEELNLGESSEVPEVGDTIRTKKMQMEGKVVSVGKASAGYDEVKFRIADGRLMRTPMENVIVVEKLADEDHQMMEQELNELSNQLLTKYKSAAGQSASAADALGNIKTGNKRFSGIVKATNKQFANDAKKSVTKEDSMDGINRSAPAVDVSYQKVLDRNPKSAHSEVIGEDDILEKVMNEWAMLNELSVDKMTAYRKAAASPDAFRTRPLRKLARSVQGVKQADRKINKKTPTTDVSEAGDFNKILQRQNPEKKTEEKDYHGWKIRYDLKPAQTGAMFRWMAWHEKKGPDTAQHGKAETPEKAFQDATAFINNGGNQEAKYNSARVTIDFNSQFSSQIVPQCESFFVKFEDGFIIVSFVPQQGFAKASVRRATNEGERFWSCGLSTKEAEAQKLVPNGRYTLGSKDEIDSETSMFQLHFQNVAQSSNDKTRMREPGFIVAAGRE